MMDKLKTEVMAPIPEDRWQLPKENRHPLNPKLDRQMREQRRLLREAEEAAAQRSFPEDETEDEEEEEEEDVEDIDGEL